ncbi:hypothetical protein DFH09DRAFT_1322542 [Mycena vulgaris]|nr:hypothetical protein DFH09DRAFT_1322542 [Mycena vulgaris]
MYRGFFVTSSSWLDQKNRLRISTTGTFLKMLEAKPAAFFHEHVCYVGVGIPSITTEEIVRVLSKYSGPVGLGLFLLSRTSTDVLLQAHAVEETDCLQISGDACLKLHGAKPASSSQDLVRQ